MGFTLKAFNIRPAVVITAALLSGCATLSPGGHVARNLPKHVVSPVGDTTAADAARAGTEYERDPSNAKAGIAYGRSLRELGSAHEASLVLARTLAENPDNAELLAEYAKALTADGRPSAALPVFQRAESFKPGDWSLLSAEGIALDEAGEHEEARGKYKSALKLSRDNPNILANLGLSLALSGQLDEAEATLRQAVSQPGAGTQVRQNLALVLGLRGRFGEAEQLARADLDPQTAQNNLAMMRQMYGKPAQWADARDAAAKVAAKQPETIPAPMPVVQREDMIGSGVTAAILPRPASSVELAKASPRAQAVKTASAVPSAPRIHAPQKTKPAATAVGNGPDDSFVVKRSSSAVGNGVDNAFYGFPK